MTDSRFSQALEKTVPPMPACFDQAMKNALAAIAAEETKAASSAPARAERRSVPAARHAGRAGKRWLAYLLAAILLLGATALAIGSLRKNVFEVALNINPQNARQLIQYDLAKESYGECDIEIKQAAYDGMTLYLVYSVRERAATELLGEVDEETGERYLVEETMPAMERDNLGWWVDHLWINGESVDMPAGSSQWCEAGDAPGELLFYQTWCLDQEDVYLSGKRDEISLPIGERQPLDSLVLLDRENWLYEKPEKGMVTFYLDCSSRNGVTVTHPNEWKDMGDFAIVASEVTYSPIQMYATFDVKINPDSLAAFIAENGEGWYDEQGTLIFPYDGSELMEDWIYSVELVDGAGVPVDFGEADNGYFGCQGWGVAGITYTFPYVESYPEEMFLAPVRDGAADMTRAVRVK